MLAVLLHSSQPVRFVHEQELYLDSLLKHGTDVRWWFLTRTRARIALYVVPKLLNCFRSFTYPSAGLTYCAIGALAFLNHHPEEGLASLDLTRSHCISLNDCTRWILARQTTYLEDEEIDTEEQNAELTQPEAIPLPFSPLGSAHTAHFPATTLPPQNAASSAMTQNAKAPILNILEEDIRWAGFNGRPNKIADTCYCFWNTGALAVGICLSLLIAALLTESIDAGSP